MQKNKTDIYKTIFGIILFAAVIGCDVRKNDKQGDIPYNRR